MKKPIESIQARSVQFMSKFLVELVIEPSYIISITESGETVKFAVDHKSVLSLVFDDIQEYLDGYRLFSITDAKRIFDWLKTLPVDAHVIVHCHAGRSRSVAVAEFLIKSLGYRHIKTPRLNNSFDLANGHVYGTLRRVHYDLSREINLQAEAEYERVCKEAPRWT